MSPSGVEASQRRVSEHRPRRVGIQRDAAVRGAEGRAPHLNRPRHLAELRIDERDVTTQPVRHPDRTEPDCEAGRRPVLQRKVSPSRPAPPGRSASASDPRCCRPRRHPRRQQPGPARSRRGSRPRSSFVCGSITPRWFGCDPTEAAVRSVPEDEREPRAPRPRRGRLRREARAVAAARAAARSRPRRPGRARRRRGRAETTRAARRAAAW